jgi:hypothetical protein
MVLLTGSKFSIPYYNFLSNITINLIVIRSYNNYYVAFCLISPIGKERRSSKVIWGPAFCVSGGFGTDAQKMGL